jgi:hypothetical protein
LPQTVADFCAQLQARSDEELAEISRRPYPEDALLSSANPASDARVHAAGARAVAPDIARRKRPTFKSRFRTWLRKGHSIPLTGYRVVIDLLRDAKS